MQQLFFLKLYEIHLIKVLQLLKETNMKKLLKYESCSKVSKTI